MVKGIKFGIGFFVGLGLSAAFAYVVSGTVKTWTTGETLTATDLNTTVNSLKTAIEGASQYFEVKIHAYQGSTGYNTLASSGAEPIATEVQSNVPRAGTIKNTSLIVLSNDSVGACTITLRRNGVDTDISFAVPAGSTNATIEPDTVPVAANDLLGWKFVCGGTFALNILHAVIRFEY